MWLSRQVRPGAATADADLGITTISGQKVGVVTRGEVRDLPVYGPGGYLWTPANGAAVLVVKGGPGGEEQCVAGTRPLEEVREIAPGEVYLYGPGENSVYLKADGSVEIRGSRVTVAGELSIEGRLTVNGEPYRPCNG
jgi:hypothetical protein|nr:hypothetical protein [uncultured Oscillibacter sp.]